MIIFNGNNMLSQEALHLEIKNKLDLPDWYGANLDALWDCLTGWIDLPLQIEWQNFGIVEEYLGEYALRALKVFEDASDVNVTINYWE